MRHVKLLLILAAVSAASAGVTHVWDRYRMGLRESADRRLLDSRQDALERLESAQDDLKELLAQNRKLQDSLERELSAEKKRFFALQQRFWDVMAQNKSLIRKVLVYKVGESRESDLQRRLQENILRNEELGRQLMALKKRIEVDSALSPAGPGIAGDDTAKKLAWLKTRDELNQAELDRRQEKMRALQDKTQKMEEKLALAMEQFKEMERESALLRERNISLQLEREELVEELDGARAELGQLQEKLSQIGQLLIAQRGSSAGTFVMDQEGAGPSAGDPGKKVDVEIVPGRTVGK